MQFEVQLIHIGRETQAMHGKTLTYIQVGPPLHLAPAIWRSKCELMLKAHFTQRDQKHR